MGKVLALPLLAAAAALTLCAQNTGNKVKYTCFSSGRYTVSYSSNVLHYCWDKVHYTGATVPAHIKEHFDNLDRELKNAMADKDRVLAGLQASRSRARATTAGSQGTIPAVAPAAQVPLQRLREIAIGATRAQLLEKFGEPSGRIAGLGEDQLETWTYIAEGGAFAGIKLANGAVSAVQLPQ